MFDWKKSVKILIVMYFIISNNKFFYFNYVGFGFNKKNFF